MPIASRIFPISHLLGVTYLFLLFIFLLLGPVLRAVPSGPDNVSMRIRARRCAPAVRVPSFPTITMNYHKSPLHVERCGCSFVKQPRVKSILVPLSRSMLLNRYHFSAISREWARPFSYLNSENELVYVERGTSSPSAARALPFPRRSIVVSVNNEMGNVIDAFWEISILILVLKERKKERKKDNNSVLEFYLSINLFR